MTLRIETSVQRVKNQPNILIYMFMWCTRIRDQTTN